LLAPPNKKIYLPLVIIFFFAVDQLTKYLARTNLERVGDVSVIGNLLRLHLVYNYHGVFGFSFGDGIILRYLLPIVGIAFIILLSLRAKSGFSLFIYGLILGGALGNIFDRVVFGRVTDFIDMGIGRWRWWTYNLADAFIVIGIFLLLFFPERRKE